MSACTLALITGGAGISEGMITTGGSGVGGSGVEAGFCMGCYKLSGRIVYH